MSYLIALYVYYHGNNLSVFGIDKGALEDDLNNSGLYNHAEMIDTNLVPQEVVAGIMEEQEKEAVTNTVLNYDDMMREAISIAQKESYMMHKSGIVDNIYSDTTETVVDEFEDSSIDLDLFNTLNGF